MTTVRRVILLTLAAILLFGLVSVQAARAGAVTSLAEIDAYVAQKAKESSIPGISYAIVEKGKVVHLYAAGTARPDGTPMTPQTPSLVGSVGKTFTALAAQQLIRAGKLDPEAPVRKYIPWFRVADEQASDQMTVGDLIEHKSGFNTLSGNDPIFYEPGVSGEEYARRMAAVALDRPVGSSYEYSNLNYHLLGVIIEKASGMSYGDYVQKYIFEPLEMTHSFSTREEAMAAGGAQGYRFWYGMALPDNTPLPEGAVASGFHYASAEDMAHYLIAFSSHGIYNGYSIIEPGGKAPDGKQPTTIYNIDWLPRDPLSPGNTEGHSGAWLSSSSGILFMPQEQIGVAVLANATPGQLFQNVRTPFNITYDVLRMYTGNPVGPATQPLVKMYLIMDIVLLALAGTVVWRGLALRGQPGVVKTTLDLLLPILLLVVLPAFAAALPGAFVLWPWWNWSRLFFSIPDLGYAWFAIGMAWLAVGLIRLARSFSGRSRPA